MPSVNTQRGAEGPVGDRLQPALLDRLADDDPTKRTEASDAVVMTRARLRRAVLRDIQWILNTTNLESGNDLSAFPEVRRSVVNFGIPALSGRRILDLDWNELAEAIKDAIVAFEPRVRAESLEVRVIMTATTVDHHNVLPFEIRGQLWSLPYPMELLLRSNIDLETGQVVLVDQTAGATS